MENQASNAVPFLTLMQDLGNENCEVKAQMAAIDLSLAVNYIPAVICLAKAALISFCLAIVQPWHHLGGFIIFAMLLNIDRSVSCAKIFDENAVQMVILAAWIINVLRAAVETSKLAQTLNPVSSVLWVSLSLALVVEPRMVQECFVLYGQGSGGTAHKLMPAVLTSLMVGVISFTPMPDESGAVKSIRALSFAALCVLWVYVVSVWRRNKRQVANVCVFETHALIARFCPVLYVHSVLAFWFVVACLGCVVYHYVRMHVAAASVTSTDEGKSYVPEKITTKEVKESKECRPKAQSVPVLMTDLQLPESNLQDMSTIAEEDEEALEAYFRSACQNRQSEV